MSSNALIKNSITALRFYGYINQNMEYVNDTLTINIDGYSCTINFKNTLIPRSNIEKAYLLLNDNYTIVLAIISNGYTDRKEYEKFLKIKGDSFKLLLYHFNVNSKNLNNIYENSIAEEITEQKINNFEINENQLVLKIGNRINPTDYKIDYNFARLTQPIKNKSENKTIKELNQSDENISATHLSQNQTSDQKDDQNNNQSHASEQPKNLKKSYENSIVKEIAKQETNNFEINESDNKTIKELNQSDENIFNQQIKAPLSQTQTSDQTLLNKHDHSNNQSHGSEQPNKKRSFIEKIKPFIFVLSLCSFLFYCSKILLINIKKK